MTTNQANYQRPDYQETIHGPRPARVKRAVWLGVILGNILGQDFVMEKMLPSDAQAEFRELRRYERGRYKSPSPAFGYEAVFRIFSPNENGELELASIRLVHPETGQSVDLKLPEGKKPEPKPSPLEAEAGQNLGPTQSRLELIE